MHRTKNSIAKAVGITLAGAALATLGAGVAQAESVVNAVNSVSEEGAEQTAAVPSAQAPGPSVMVVGVPLTPAAALGMLNR